MNEIEYLDIKINKLIREREQWQLVAEKTTSTISDMPHGGNGEDQRELAMCEMADCDIKINKLIDKQYDLKQLEILLSKINI